MDDHQCEQLTQLVLQKLFFIIIISRQGAEIRQNECYRAVPRRFRKVSSRRKVSQRSHADDKSKSSDRKAAADEVSNCHFKDGITIRYYARQRLIFFSCLDNQFRCIPTVQPRYTTELWTSQRSVLRFLAFISLNSRKFSQHGTKWFRTCNN